MGGFHQRHQIRDGAFGMLHALFGLAVHRVEILNDRGQMIGKGNGPTEAAARERAWKDVHKKD